MKRIALIVSVIALLSSCGKGPDSPAPQPSQPDPQQQPQPQQPTPPAPPAPTPGPGHHPTPAPAPQPMPPPPSPQDPEIARFHKAALWARPRPNSMSWTHTVISVVRARIREFERARDVETFCPGYGSATAAQRQVCWLRLVGSIVEFESSFKPDEKPFYEGHGVYSVGLLALSTGECVNAPNTRDLMDPVKNLICGVNKMAFLIARGSAINDPSNRGASAYWSTLRPRHRAQLPDGRWVYLGKKDEIIARTKTFKNFP